MATVLFGQMQDRFEQPDIKKGFILDGYPRALTQAKTLDEILNTKKYEYQDAGEHVSFFCFFPAYCGVGSGASFLEYEFAGCATSGKTLYYK